MPSTTSARTVILGTGGTIAGRSQAASDNVGYRAGEVSVADLLAAVPALAGHALEARQLAQVDSKDMDHGLWQGLAQAVAEALAREDVQGVVITHGTDTLEETAWFLHRVLAPTKSVVLTAAMRPASALMPDGPQNLPPFTAGAHIDLRLPGGLVRQYSLSNVPADGGRYVLGVLREPASRGGSAAVHQALPEGAVVEVSPPRNHFGLAEAAEQHLLLAGGIGITPLLCMAERLAVAGADFRLHYATRSRARTAFAERIAQAGFAPRVQFHFDDGAPAQRLDIEAVLKDAHPGTHLYVCGPQGFMDAVLGAARRRGWPEAELHYEFFGAAPVDAAGNRAFEVQLASSGRVIPVAADRSVVQALAEAGVTVMTSCEQGVCGTCLTRVIDGQPEHRDQYLTPEEQAANDQFLPCCSRAKSARLVLDL